jgi:pyruvate formate lyase activating enzyme
MSNELIHHQNRNGIKSAVITSNQNEPLGHVTEILLQSFVDGPGNRAVVFLQGCNFRCLYCHNPYTLRQCTQCGICVDACPSSALSIRDDAIAWDESKCKDQETCIRFCPFFSTPKTKMYPPKQLWEAIAPRSDYLSGVTVSGGEPTLQIDFLCHFFFIVKLMSDLETMIETNGHVEKDKLSQLLSHLDLAYVDLKAWDPDLHKELTGQDNARTKNTIRYLAQAGKLGAVRVTVVPNYTDTIENANQTARFLKSINPETPLCFLKFRPHGVRGAAQNWHSPSDETMDLMVQVAKSAGLKKVSRSL